MKRRNVLRVTAIVGCLALGLGTPLVAHADTTTAAAPGADLSNEQVAAIAKSGVVFVDVKWSGYTLIPASSTKPATWTDKIDTEATCSGFVADPTGFVVTAGHCADPGEGRILLIDQFLADKVADGTISQAGSDALRPDAEINWKVEGLNNGSDIVSTVTVYQTAAASSVAVTTPFTAAVIEDRPLDKGDVALLKVSSPTPMPALQVAAAEPETGADIAAIGFPGSVTATMDPSLEPSFETGQTSAMQSYNGLPFLQHNATISAGMSGGPVVNMQGQVVGVVSGSPTGETAALNFAAGSDTINGLLRRGGVTQTLSATDQTFRDGLTAFYAKDYRSSIPLFQKVLDAVPSHAQAQAYETKARALAPSQPQPVVVTDDSSGLPMVVWAAIAVVLILAAAGGVLLWVKKRNTTPAPAAVPVVPVVPEGQPHIENLPILHVAEMAPHFCPNCGTPNNGARYCPSCGAPQLQVPAVGPDPKHSADGGPSDANTVPTQP